MTKKQWKTLSVDEEIYNIVEEKRKKLVIENGGDNVQISYVTEMAILEGISNVTLNEFDTFIEKKKNKEG